MADFLRIGNIVSPNGASIIFGQDSTEDNLNIQTANSDTYQPYDIVIIEEEEDETIPAEQISYTPGANSNITSTNAQSAISELEQIVYDNVPTFTQETWTLSVNQTSQVLTKTFSSTAMMVFYNGLLINPSIHYSFASNTISLIDFAAEEGDILTVIGLASAAGGSSSSSGAASLSLIEEAY